MLLFDYTYYIFANLYGLARSERQTDSWKGSGIVVSSLCHCFFIMAIVMFFGKEYAILIMNPFSGITLMLIIFIFFIVRYNKITNYQKIEKRLKSLSKQQQLILNIVITIYLLIAIPGFFILVIIGVDKSLLI